MTLKLLESGSYCLFQEKQKFFKTSKRMRARARPLILSHLHPARALTTKTTLWTTFSWRQSRNQQTTTTKSSSPSLRKWCYQPPLFCNLRFCDHPVKPDTSEAKLLPPWGTTAQRRKTSKAQLLLPWGITSQRRKKTSNTHLLPPRGTTARRRKTSNAQLLPPWDTTSKWNILHLLSQTSVHHWGGNQVLAKSYNCNVSIFNVRPLGCNICISRSQSPNTVSWVHVLQKEWNYKMRREN